MARLVVIEGIDNVGKTTTCQVLARALRGQGEAAMYYKTPPRQFASASAMINAEAKTDAHFLYHLAMVKYAEQEIAAILKGGTSVVCDRYFYSTVAYHVAASSALVFDLGVLIERPPDLAVLLVTSDECERVRRGYAKQEPEIHDLKSKQDEPLLARAEQIMQGFGLVQLDNSRLSVNAVVEPVLAQLDG